MTENVKKYYQTPESKYGFKFITMDAQHFGYYPNVNDDISEFAAQRELHKLLATYLESGRHKKVLDAGCGRAVVACDLAQNFDVEIVGVDVTPYIVEKAKERVRKLALEGKVRIEKADYSNTGFPDESFDAVYTVETLSHAVSLKKVLQEFHRILKPGGLGVFIEYEMTDFNKFNPYELEMYKLIKDGSAMNSLDEFMEGNFVKLLNDAGLSLVRDMDITKNRSKSMKRLYNIAYLPYLVIKAFNLRRFFINTTAGVEFYRLNEKNLFRYHIYKVNKAA